tara:strand:- start:1078 stop:1809 length:732 start_codon:yes stop_codon:yes gene_type:complete
MSLDQIERIIIKLKLAESDVKLMRNQLKEGSEDLHFRLSHFRKRITNQDKEKFDKHFFGIRSNSKKSDIENKSIVKVENKIAPTASAHKNKLPPQHAWLKKTYKEIVKSTHPDKFVNFPIKNIVEKYVNIYREANEAWGNANYEKIILCAHEVDIKVENKKAIPIVHAGIEKIQKEIRDIKNLLAYSWYHVPTKDRPQVLEKYLTQLGYHFTSEEVKNVVNLARKRKTGTKPKSLRRSRQINP